MVMLRNHSRRAVSSKQSSMADNKSFSSPRFFNGFLTRSLSDVLVDSEISPKSILDSKQIFNLGNPFGYDRNSSYANYEDKKSSSTLEGIKLIALLDPIENEENINSTSKMVVFGTELKDFGIKTKDSHVLAFGNVKEDKDSSKGGLSLREMESLEDYTCICHSCGADVEEPKTNDWIGVKYTVYLVYALQVFIRQEIEKNALDGCPSFEKEEGHGKISSVIHGSPVKKSHLTSVVNMLSLDFYIF
ncbi:hypothetical protein KY285_036511 [Solanum tuberosum]|nr:hypothetical protein KY285_036511 [Solanum tuberosum]